jgi:hypothetical protein
LAGGAPPRAKIRSKNLKSTTNIRTGQEVAPPSHSTNGNGRPLEVRADSIPIELRERNQWVLWRYEICDGRQTKIPINARTGRRAKSVDSATWATFAEALAEVERHWAAQNRGFWAL